MIPATVAVENNIDCCQENRVADFQKYKWPWLAHDLQDKLLNYAEEERFIPDSEEAFQLT